MSALIRKILNGIFNMNFLKSTGKREVKMLNFKTNVPQLDKENDSLFRASSILEQIGNEPNPTANEFYDQLLLSDLPTDDYEDLILAAISIEMMMKVDDSDIFFEATVH